MDASLHRSITDAARWLQTAERIAVLTGAGISAESGVPTFRGADSVWRGQTPESLATPQAFAQDPQSVWEWYDWRRGRIAAVEPNPGHYALVALEQRCRDFTLITQNVDGLHARAGSRDIAYLHGDIWTLRCLACQQSVRDLSPHLDSLPPRCPCGGMQRPGVVWFGESLPAGAWQRAEEAARRAEIFLVIGTSAVVVPAADLISLARRNGAKVVEVNAGETRITASVDLSLRGLSGEILPTLVAML